MESWDSLLFLTDTYKAQWCIFWEEMQVERERRRNEWYKLQKVQDNDMDLSD